MTSENNSKRKANFIYFENEIVGKENKYIHVRMNINKIIKYLKRNEEGDWMLDFFIARRKKPVKGKWYIAWTEEEPVIDNSELVESILDDSKKPE